MSSFTEEPQSGPETGADRETGVDDTAASPQRRPIRRPARGRMLAGVAAGISQHFNIDVTIVRIVFAVLTIVGFTGLAYLGGMPLYLGGIPLYLACWLLIPEEGSEHSIASTLLRNAQQRRSQ
jgi:phage shock protein PspC (stress-responsive transcriptional regulator)